MPSVCTFTLNKENATYFSGETITGTVTLKTTSDKNVRDVSIIFLGEGKVKWDESYTTTDSEGSTTTNTTYYRSRETYINNSTLVHCEGVLSAGTYTYTFNIPLPLECPTSCEGLYGHIRYEISLKINRYFRFDNIYKKPVTILKTVDLNLYPEYKKIFGAYAPGQYVKYDLTIANQSMDDTEGYQIEFTQKITFTAKSPYRKQRHTKSVLVLRYFPDKCLRLTNRVIQGKFLIPATPSTSERSSIICVEYTFKLTVQLACCNSNPVLKIPIIIGTIPIREQQQLSPTAPDMSELTNQDVGVDSNQLNNSNEMQPPSFEEATGSCSPFIDTDVDERNRIVGFRPLYPMYNQNSSEKY